MQISRGARRAALAAAALLLAASPLGLASAAPAPPARDQVPGVLGVDHFGITVPDVEAARDWFVNVLGCVAPLSFGPFSDPSGALMQRLVGVHPRAVLEKIVMVRCGTGSSIELFQWDAPRQDQTFAKNSDWSGHHIALYVEDIQAAVAYLEAQPGVRKLLGPLPVTEGPAAGQSINYFRTFFGLYLELISYPDGMAYEATAETRLWNPADVGAAPSGTGLPGMLGVDHFGMTVPDIARAREWFERVLGCTAPLRFGPFSDPEGDFMTQLLDVHPRAVIHEIDMLRCGSNGANVELFEWSSPDQDRTFPLNSDFAGSHVALYVEDIEAAAAAMKLGKGVRPFLGPFPVTGGPAAGQSINYFWAPQVGHYVELISYPDGMAYEETAETPLWSPRDP